MRPKHVASRVNTNLREPIMAKAKTAAERAKFLVTLSLGTGKGTPVYATPTGLRKGAKGKVQPVGYLFATLDKGNVRRIRKAARSIGRMDIAMAKRDAGFSVVG